MVEGPGRASRITSIPPTVDVTDVTDPQGVAVAEALRNSLHPPSSLRAEPQALVASPSDRLRGAPTHSSLVNGGRSALLHPRFRKVSHNPNLRRFSQSIVSINPYIHHHDEYYL